MKYEPQQNQKDIDRYRYKNLGYWYIRWDFRGKICLCNYRGTRYAMMWPAIYKLKNQESCSIIQPKFKGLKTRGDDDIAPSLRPEKARRLEKGGEHIASYWCKCQDPKAWNQPGVPVTGDRRGWMSQLQQNEHAPFLCLFVQVLYGLDDACLHCLG